LLSMKAGFLPRLLFRRCLQKRDLLAFQGTDKLTLDNSELSDEKSNEPV